MHRVIIILSMAIPWVSLLSLAKLKRTILIATLLLFSWPSIVTPMSWVAGLVKIIQVDSFFFCFFYGFNYYYFNFLISYKIICLGFVIFSLFFLLRYFKSGLIKLTWSACIFVHNIFFYLAWTFFCLVLLLKVYFFISISYRMWRVGRVNRIYLDLFSSIVYDFFFSISSFCNKLLTLELCYFFTFLSVWLS
jgi:hypothetical protein